MSDIILIALMVISACVPATVLGKYGAELMSRWCDPDRERRMLERRERIAQLDEQIAASKARQEEYIDALTRLTAICENTHTYWPACANCRGTGCAWPDDMDSPACDVCTGTGRLKPVRQEDGHV